MNLITANLAFATAVINKSPAETVGPIITEHLARIARIEAWATQHFKFLQVDPPK